MDSKLIQGLLIVTCLALLCSIGLTIADIMQFRGQTAAVATK